MDLRTVCVHLFTYSLTLNFYVSCRNLVWSIFRFFVNIISKFSCFFGLLSLGFYRWDVRSDLNVNRVAAMYKLTWEVFRASGFPCALPSGSTIMLLYFALLRIDNNNNKSQVGCRPGHRVRPQNQHWPGDPVVSGLNRSKSVNKMHQKCLESPGSKFFYWQNV